MSTKPTPSSKPASGELASASGKKRKADSDAEESDSEKTDSDDTPKKGARAKMCKHSCMTPDAKGHEEGWQIQCTDCERTVELNSKGHFVLSKGQKSKPKAKAKTKAAAAKAGKDEDGSDDDEDDSEFAPEAAKSLHEREPTDSELVISYEALTGLSRQCAVEAAKHGVIKYLKSKRRLVAHEMKFGDDVESLIEYAKDKGDAKIFDRQHAFTSRDAMNKALALKLEQDETSANAILKEQAKPKAAVAADASPKKTPPPVVAKAATAKAATTAAAPAVAAKAAPASGSKKSKPAPEEAETKKKPAEGDKKKSKAVAPKVAAVLSNGDDDDTPATTTTTTTDAKSSPPAAAVAKNAEVADYD